MPTAQLDPIPLDFIEELRLRRWAREHFVAPESRNPDWHPIVLEEMSLKDDETNTQARSRLLSVSYVPLVPNGTPLSEFAASKGTGVAL